MAEWSMAVVFESLIGRFLEIRDFSA